MLGVGNASGTVPQTLDQLLERQWEQGSQFLMEQAQHFDSKSRISLFYFFNSYVTKNPAQDGI